MAADGARRPVPVPDASSAPYWTAAATHVLALPRCSRCDRLTLPPDSACPHCHSTEPGFVFEPVRGDGVVRSWTIVRRSFLPGFDVPYVLVDVELDVQADLRMLGRLLDGPGAAIHQGDPVAVAFEDLAPGVSVPAFVLKAGS